jgi:hypothetical protein
MTSLGSHKGKREGVLKFDSSQSLPEAEKGYCDNQEMFEREEK